MHVCGAYCPSAQDMYVVDFIHKISLEDLLHTTITSKSSYERHIKTGLSVLSEMFSFISPYPPFLIFLKILV